MQLRAPRSTVSTLPPRGAARRIAGLALTMLATVLVGCASGPRGPAAGRDGPEANPPSNLMQVPDAEPRLEPIRIGGPNKPYEFGGQTYVPIKQDVPFHERGLASWYGRKFQGRPTSSGELYNMYAMTAAHPTLPIPSYARVRNPANGREVVVRINDRGPFHSSRIVDLSYTAALKLDVLRGVAPVELTRITFDEIRSGTWRRLEAPTPAAPPVETVADPLPARTPAVVAPPEGLASAPPPADVPASMPPPPAPDAEAGAPAAIADAPSARAFTPPARGFWLQLGAFRQRAGAEQFQRRVGDEVAWVAPLLALFNDAGLFRLQAGPYPSRDEARTAGERLRGELQLTPVIVERR